MYVGHRCEREDSVMDSHTTGPDSRFGRHGLPSTELLTDHHHNSIIKLTVCCYVWKVGAGFSGRV